MESDLIRNTALSPGSMGKQIREEGLVTWPLFPCFTREASDVWSWDRVTAILCEVSGEAWAGSADKGHTCLATAPAMGPGPHLLPSSLGVTPQLFSSLLVTWHHSTYFLFPVHLPPSLTQEMRTQLSTFLDWWSLVTPVVQHYSYLEPQEILKVTQQLVL